MSDHVALSVQSRETCPRAASRVPALGPIALLGEGPGKFGRHRVLALLTDARLIVLYDGTDEMEPLPREAIDLVRHKSKGARSIVETADGRRLDVDGALGRLVDRWIGNDEPSASEDLGPAVGGGPSEAVVVLDVHSRLDPVGYVLGRDGVLVAARWDGAGPPPVIGDRVEVAYEPALGSGELAVAVSRHIDPAMDVSTI